MRILATVGIMALSSWTGATVYADYDPATHTDTLTNQMVSPSRGNTAVGDFSTYDHADRNLVIQWNNNSRGDGAPIRDARVNAKNITINADFSGNQWTDKGIISDGTTHVTAGGDIDITTHNDGVYTEGNGSTTIDGFKNLTIKATGDNWWRGGGFGVVDNGGGITIQGGNDSKVDISTVTSVQAAVGNSVRDNTVGTGVTISANEIKLDAPGKAIYAAPGKNGDFAVNLNASKVTINGAVQSVGGRIAVNQNQIGLVQIYGDVQAHNGGLIDLNLNGEDSSLHGTIKTDGTYAANDKASIHAQFSGANSSMTGDIQTRTDHSTITADFSGENNTLTGDVKATGTPPTKSWFYGWRSASGTTLNLNMTGANAAQKGNLVADGSNTLNANYTGTVQA